MIALSCFKGGPVILRLDLEALLFPVARLSRSICTAVQVGKLEKKGGREGLKRRKNYSTGMRQRASIEASIEASHGTKECTYIHEW